MDNKKLNELRLFAEEIRVTALEEFQALGFGHIGGAMSIIEVLAALYGHYMKVDPANPRWEDRDWLVLSKGHAGPALYATLALKGFFPKEVLMTLNHGGTTLPSHCDRNKTPGIDITTGSLGQGMSAALGVALGNRLSGKDTTTYLILGDGECDEGQVWEGALMAPNFKLDNLVAFVDYNAKQLDGTIKEIMDLGDLAGKWRAFGWHVQEIDGHHIGEICDAIDAAKATKGLPSMIVLKTMKGKGCTLTEGVESNHHINFKPEQMAEALAAARKVYDAAKARV